MEKKKELRGGERRAGGSGRVGGIERVRGHGSYGIALTFDLIPFQLFPRPRADPYQLYLETRLCLASDSGFESLGRRLSSPGSRDRRSGVGRKATFRGAFPRFPFPPTRVRGLLERLPVPGEP